LAIQSYTALFSLLGTTYGGDGVRTFQLPNLQGRTPVGVSSSINWGELAGEVAHTLISTEVPPHTHQMNAGISAAANKPAGNMVASGGANFYTTAAAQTPMNQGTLLVAGASQSHPNMQPYLVMNWVIAYVGIFPSRG